VSGRGGSGSFDSGRTAGYAIGEERTSTWLESIAGLGSTKDPAIVSQAGLQLARAGSPKLWAPRTRYEATVRTSARVFTGSVPRLKHTPFRASVSVFGVIPCGRGR